MRMGIPGWMKRPGWWVIPLFIILGIAFFAFGILLFISAEENNELHKLHYTLTFEAAVIFITATIIETLLVKEFGNRAMGTMKEVGTETFTLLKNADYNGIIDILPPRLDSSKDQNNKSRNDLTFSQHCDALTKTKKVKIFCFSERLFLMRRYQSGFYEIFLNKASSDPDYEVQILLANGYGAKIKGARENPNRPDDLAKGIKSTQDEIEDLHKSAGRDNVIKTKYYNFIPQAGFVITENKMFLEPYHLADHNDLKNLRKKQFPDNEPWSGGRVPIFVVQKDSTLYDAMDNYFDWLWGPEETSEKLNQLPTGVIFPPEDLKDKVDYYTSQKLLVFKGVMSNEEKNRLIGIAHRDVLYVKAINTLYQKTQRDTTIFNDGFKEYFNVEDDVASITTDKAGEEHG